MATWCSRRQLLVLAGLLVPVMACQSREDELGGLVDACLERENDLNRTLSSCRDELAAAESALTGHGRDEPAEAAPLMPIRARVWSRPGQTAELEFEARSYAAEPIASYRYRARLFNAFDELVPCNHEDNEGPTMCVEGAEEFWESREAVIEFRRSDRIRRTIADFPRATKAIVTIYEVTFADGEVWRGSAVGFPTLPPPRVPEGQAEGEAGSQERDHAFRMPELAPLAPSPRLEPEGRR